MKGSEFLIKNLSDLIFADASMLALEVGIPTKGNREERKAK